MKTFLLLIKETTLSLIHLNSLRTNISQKYNLLGDQALIGIIQDVFLKEEIKGYPSWPESKGLLAVRLMQFVTC